MTESTPSIDFSRWFSAALGHAPYAWQEGLATESAPRHRLIRIPTGFGKTHGIAAAWLFNRVIRADPAWPLRLVWALPMRTLVEQTEAACRQLLGAVDRLWHGGAHDEKVGVHVLMGGADAGPYHLHPEQPAILIGTQDMLLSRALNRGYGAARARWPIDFGLLSQDALWVLDEVQLMGVGFATALQLAAFRDRHRALRPTYTWAMSATLQRAWLEKSPDTSALDAAMESCGIGAADEALPLWTSSHKPVERLAPESVVSLADRVIETHVSQPGERVVSLAICNTVDRACALFDALCKRVKDQPIRVDLVHSRFRGAERRVWRETILDCLEPNLSESSDRADSIVLSRVLVATQVVEAGVDISADVLFTELCPWPSLVQRLGRLARRGGAGRAFVIGLDTERHAAPYESAALDAAWEAIGALTDVSPRCLEAFEASRPERVDVLYPFEPPHLVLEEEVADLFDTTADLSGGDLDVSRFIREGDERDVSVAWVALARGEAPGPELRPGRDALCSVPFLMARDWLCGKKTGGIEPRRLRSGVAAFVWDYLDGRWRRCERNDLRPGAQVLVDAAIGGYDPRRGFDPKHRAPVPVVPMVVADAQERADAAQDAEDLSRAQWQTIGFHGAAVAAEINRSMAGLAVSEPIRAMRPILDLAARWHDLGKAHPAFQGAIAGSDRPVRRDLAKAPNAAWRTGRCVYQMGHPPEPRPGLRHELASALALFDVLARWAPADHPARLGVLAAIVEPTDERAEVASNVGPSAVEAEVLELPAEAFDLVVYLVCCHHGKLRARLHASPADQAAAMRRGSLPIRGVYEGDRLPSVRLAAPGGGLAVLPESRLSLDPAALGLSPLTGRSWVERVDGLRARHGPFALAYLETILRAADVRASMDGGLVDAELSATDFGAEEREDVR